MNNIFNVFSFEFKSIFKKKTYMVTTLVISLIIIGLTFIPKFTNRSKKNTPESATKTNSKVQEEIKNKFKGSGYVLKTDEVKDFSLTVFFEHKYEDESSLKADVESGKLQYGFVFENGKTYKIITKGGAVGEIKAIVDTYLLNFNREKVLKENNVNPNIANALFDIKINSDVLDLNRNAKGNIFFAMIYTISIYMLIIFYGSTVSTSIAREKDNRTMEILIANTKPDSLIVGKTLAAGSAGIIQMAIFILAGVIGIKINYEHFKGISDVLLNTFNYLDIRIILITVFYGISGYCVYLFLYASLGALVSKMEDVQYAVGPITFLLVMAYMLTQFGMQAPENMIFKIGSYIPFTAILCMPVRYSLVKVPDIELFISIGIMLVSILILSVLAIRIYRLGTLNYGNRMKFFKSLKIILKGEDK